MNKSGIITAIDGNLLTIAICQEESCQSCGAKLICNASNSKIKHIECSVSDVATFNVGENVTVSVSGAFSLKAVTLAFIIPLIILFAVLFILEHGSLLSEAGNALLALCAVSAYYGLLYLFRDSIKKKFIFNVEKQK